MNACFHKATDHAYPLVMLADALAGLVRDAQEDKQSDEATLLQRGCDRGQIEKRPIQGAASLFRIAPDLPSKKGRLSASTGYSVSNKQCGR